MKPGELISRPRAHLPSTHCLDVTILRPDPFQEMCDERKTLTLQHVCMLQACGMEPSLSLLLCLYIQSVTESCHLTASKVHPWKEGVPTNTSAQALTARVITVLPSQRAAGCEWRGLHQPEGLAEPQGSEEWEGKSGCPSKATSDLGWGWSIGAGHTASWGSDLDTINPCYSRIAR